MRFWFLSRVAASDHQPTTTMKKYTIAELTSAKTFADIEGKTQTGATKEVQYKIVPLAGSETFDKAIVVSVAGGKIQVIDRPELRKQFLDRGC